MSKANNCLIIYCLLNYLKELSPMCSKSLLPLNSLVCGVRKEVKLTFHHTSLIDEGLFDLQLKQHIFHQISTRRSNENVQVICLKMIKPLEHPFITNRTRSYVAVCLPKQLQIAAARLITLYSFRDVCYLEKHRQQSTVNPSNCYFKSQYKEVIHLHTSQS